MQSLLCIRCVGLVGEIAYANLGSQVQGDGNAASQIQGRGNANQVQGSDNGGGP
jgi:hypothetical protein